LRETHVENLQASNNSQICRANVNTRKSNLFRGDKTINLRPWRAARRNEHEPVFFLEQANPSVIRVGVIIMQPNVDKWINVESLTEAKCAIIEHLMEKHKATTIFLQETRSLDLSKLKNTGYTLAVRTFSSIHGRATFVENSVSWTQFSSSEPDNEVVWTTTEIEGNTAVNVYKPPDTKLQCNSIPALPACICSGDFNSHSIIWEY